MKIPAALLLAVSTAVLVACAGGGGVDSRPFAQFEPDLSVVDSDKRPAFVLEIDGEKQSIDKSYPVPPGTRKLVVSVPSGLASDRSRHESITIDARPCVRYYLAARRSQETSRVWSAFISATEPISGCRPKLASQ